jgi:hypothetical protein
MLNIIKSSAAITATVIVVIGTCLMALFLLGPKIETYLFPVNDSVSACIVGTNEKSTQIAVAATQIRSCVLTGVSAYVYRNGQWVQGEANLVDGHGNDITSAKMISKKSKLFYVIRVFPKGTTTKITVAHQCHPLWQTTTNLFTVDNDKTPNQTE